MGNEIDILQQLRQAGYQPEEVKDTGFEPFKGDYLCRIDSAGRMKGTSEKSGKEYDFRVIKLQVADIISGDRATNRFLDGNDFIFNTDLEGTKDLLNVLHTAGIDCLAKNDEELDNFLLTLRDRTMFIRTWTQPKRVKVGDEWVKAEPEQIIQRARVVKDFKSAKESKPDKVRGSVPF